MPATTVAGSLIQLFLADPTLSALVPTGGWFGDVPQEETPMPYVVVTDEGSEEKWVTPSVALVRQKVRFRCYAEAATAPGADNPANAVASAIRSALNGRDPTAALTAKISVLWVLEDSYTLKEETKRSLAGSRVYQADMALRVGYQRVT